MTAFQRSISRNLVEYTTKTGTYPYLRLPIKSGIQVLISKSGIKIAGACKQFRNACKFFSFYPFSGFQGSNDDKKPV
eukprot:22442_6